MAIKRKPVALGPGSLIFGEPGSQLDISCQVTAAKVTFDKDKEDDLPTLCGGNITGENIYTSKLEFSAAQDLEANGLIDWTWSHAGEQVPVEFIPKSSETASITGTITIDPIEFGGDVKKKNISEAEFDFVGLPAFTPDTTPDSEAFPEMTVKTFTLPAGTTGGVWSIDIDGNETDQVAFNVLGDGLKAALEELPNITTILSVVKTGMAYTVTFTDEITAATADGTALVPTGAIVVS